MDNNFISNTFTWALEDASANKQINNQPNNINQQQQQQQSQEIVNLSDADLFQFLLGEEAHQATMTQTYHTDEDSSANEDLAMKETPLSSNTASSSSTTTRKPKSSNGPPATSTGRLDFRPIHDHIPESQLKAMTSKERRQLRNKISARNFRNRRKEYIGTLEDELNQQKAENSQLKLELKWVKQKMETLQKENDKLRVDLMLGGISLPAATTATTTAPTQPTTMSVGTTSTSPYLFDSTNLLNSTLNLSNTSSSSSSDSTLSSPPNLFTDFPDNWDFVLPTEGNQNRDTYLSHAVVPHWNINHVLEKETSTAMITTPSANLIQQYPLLAPALMSIVLAHTMTMSTDEILATAKLNPLPSTHVGFNEKDPFNGSTMMTDKEAKAVWDLLEPLTMMQSRNEKLAIQPSDMKSQSTQSSTTVNPFCPLLWVQTRICRYLCEFAANYCTTNTLPSSTAAEQDSTKKFVLCRQFQKAKRYITACQ